MGVVRSHTNMEAACPEGADPKDSRKPFYNKLLMELAGGFGDRSYRETTIDPMSRLRVDSPHAPIDPQVPTASSASDRTITLHSPHLIERMNRHAAAAAYEPPHPNRDA